MTDVPRRLRSIFKPIILASIGVALSIALIVGWTAVLLNHHELTERVAANIGLMASGILSLIVIISVLIWFGIFLVREILEGRRQTSFIDSVTHELKSPLASLKLCLETMDRRGVSPEQQLRLRAMMMQDLERLAAFIDDVLAANRVTPGRQPVEQREVVLYDLVSESVSRVLRRHRLGDSAVRMDIAPELRIATDPTALETVMTNLIDNAVKYSGDRVEVEVRARRVAGHIEVEVQDHGIGISPKYVRRIFERFYRAPGETVQARRGTGLGLYVAATLVRNLRGRLVAVSEGLERGATMRLSLPATASPPA